MNEFPTNQLIAKLNSDVHILRNELIQSDEEDDMALPYKVFTGKVSQISGQTPTVEVYQNTIFV